MIVSVIPGYTRPGSGIPGDTKIYGSGIPGETRIVLGIPGDTKIDSGIPEDIG